MKTLRKLLRVGAVECTAKPFFKRFLGVWVVGAAMVFGVPTSRADDNWDFAVAPYLWSTGVDGDLTLGPVARDIDVDFSDFVDALDKGALVHVEAHKNRHGLFGDLVFMSLEPDVDFSPVGGDTDADIDTVILETGYLYKFPSKKGFYGIEVGVRYWDLELSLKPALLPDIKRSTDWLDGFIGYHIKRGLNDRWSFVGRGNIGAGVSDGSDSTWSLQGTFLRELNNGNSLAIGLKSLSIDFDDTIRNAPFEVDINFQGLVIGYVFD